jgi:hypothetical protein
MHFDSSAGSVHWDEFAGAVHVTWKRFAEREEYRAVLNAGVELLLQKKTKRWLSDLRDLGAITQEDQRWGSESWLPRATQAGMAYIALVSPRKLVAQMAVKTFMNNVNDHSVVIGNFEDLETARDWLQSQT